MYTGEFDVVFEGVEDNAKILVWDTEWIHLPW